VLDLGIVIVSYNTRDLLRDCLGSVYDSRGVSCEVWCGPTPRPTEAQIWSGRSFPGADHRQRAQWGYAYANNLGLKALVWRCNLRLPGKWPTSCFSIPTPSCRPGLVGYARFYGCPPAGRGRGPRLVLPTGNWTGPAGAASQRPCLFLPDERAQRTVFQKHPRFGAYNLTYLDETRKPRLIQWSGPS